jgi:hypothetical protein
LKRLNLKNVFVKSPQLALFLFFLSVGICAARDPLPVGIYSGAWIGPVGGGERTGNTARINIFCER